MSYYVEYREEDATCTGARGGAPASLDYIAPSSVTPGESITNFTSRRGSEGFLLEGIEDVQDSDHVQVIPCGRLNFTLVVMVASINKKVCAVLRGTSGKTGKYLPIRQPPTSCQVFR